MAAIVYFQQFKIYKHLVCAVSTRQFGSINEQGKIFKKNLQEFSKAIKIDPQQTVFVKQVHANKVAPVKNSKKRVVGEADGLITDKKNIFLGISTADCLPVVFFDPKKQIIGIAHAGYKGLLNGILENMMFEFNKMGSVGKDILIGIGPAIQACCYTVNKERIEQFQKKFPQINTFFYNEDEQFHLDLPEVAKYILSKKGILADNIEDSGICTSDINDMFFSYRKDSAKTFGEFVTVIGLV